jgi:2,4-dienoyl-CoA reductase (NADPH2)
VSELKKVWQPGTIGPLELPHRLVMGTMHLGLEVVDPSGRALAAFYGERAAGGAGLIVTGGCAVSRVGAGGASYALINEPSGDSLGLVADAVHAEGGLVLLQLFHAGRYAHERSFGLQPVAPSAVYSSYSRCEPHALSDEEILHTIEDFGAGAIRARELGFDGVEIMGSEGYLLSQFMAPATNVREDDWGGDAPRRMRFPMMVAQAVRDACGPELAVVYRLSGADLVPGGAEPDDVIALARRLASGPADALNVGIGWHESRVPTVQSGVPKAAWAPWARAVRDSVDRAPVILSNRVNTAALADSLIEEGFTDFVSMARPFLADPLFVRKNRDERSRRVNLCIACNQCIDSSIFDRRVSCVVNPRAGYESESPARKRKGDGPAAGLQVAVIGGGPAGMEAARSLAVAGFGVELIEAAPELGGQFRMARRIPGKQDFGQTGPYFTDELDRLGVTVSLGTPVAFAAALDRFDAVVVATGVRPRSIALPGVQFPHVLPYAQLLLAENPWGLAGERVVILGAGGIGTDIAHMLCAERDFYSRYGLNPPGGAGPSSQAEASRASPRQITLMRRSGRIGDGVGTSTRWVVVQELQQAGVELLTGVQYERIEPDAVVISADGQERRIPADTVVIAAGQEPEAMLATELALSGRPHVVIGGASGATGLDAGRAFREGFGAGAAVAELLGLDQALTWS